MGNTGLDKYQRDSLAFVNACNEAIENAQFTSDHIVKFECPICHKEAKCMWRWAYRRRPDFEIIERCRSLASAKCDTCGRTIIV